MRLLELPGGFLWLGPDGDRTLVATCRCAVGDVPSYGTSPPGWPARPWPSGAPGRPGARGVRRRRQLPLAATTMRLDLAGALPGEELAAGGAGAMTARSPRRTWPRGREVRREREESGSRRPSRAPPRGTRSTRCSPRRRQPGEHLLTVRHDGQACGVLWVGSRWPDQAGSTTSRSTPGSAAAAWRGTLAAPRRSAPDGHGWLGLNVFGHNQHARALRAARYWSRSTSSGTYGRLTVHSPDRILWRNGAACGRGARSVDGPVGPGNVARNPCAGRPRGRRTLSPATACGVGDRIGSTTCTATVRRVGPVTGTAGSEGRCGGPDVTSPVTPRGS